jgi:hypothetical protein
MAIRAGYDGRARHHRNVGWVKHTAAGLALHGVHRHIRGQIDFVGDVLRGFGAPALALGEENYSKAYHHAYGADADPFRMGFGSKSAPDEKHSKKDQNSGRNISNGFHVHLAASSLTSGTCCGQTGKG